MARRAAAGEGGEEGCQGLTRPPAGTVDPSSVVLPVYPPGGLQVTWDEGTGDWTMCGLVGKVFGVSVCLSPAAKDQCKDKLSPPSSPMSLCDHVAHVLAQLLDNDADGKADDERLTKFMVANNYYLVVPHGENSRLPTHGFLKTCRYGFTA